MTRTPDGKTSTWPANFAAWTLVVLILLPFGVLVAGTLLYGVMIAEAGLGQELAIVYFIGLIVIALLVGLKVAALLFSHVGIADGQSAMGLPQGSIRAILALGLLLIFAVMAMGLFVQVNQAGQIVSSTGLTAAEVQAIPSPEVVGRRERTVGAVMLFDVDRRIAGSESSEDIAKQLVTILGTLVVAVSAFYFGANSVQAASSAVAARRSTGSGSDGSVAIVSPSPPRPLTPDGTGFATYPVEVKTTPLGLAVTAHIIGDDEGLLSEPSPGTGKFVYEPSQPGNEVLLRFALAARPESSADLIVRKVDHNLPPEDTPPPEQTPPPGPAMGAAPATGRDADLKATSGAPAGGEEPPAEHKKKSFRPTPPREKSRDPRETTDDHDNMPRPG